MDTEVTDVAEPNQDDEKAAPVPWYRRPAALVGGIAGAVLLALAGGLIWAFSGDKPAPNTALKPIVPSSTPPPAPPEDEGLDFLGGLAGTGDLGGSGALSTPGDYSSGADTGMFSLPGGGSPSGTLPALNLPDQPAFQLPQAPPPEDWATLLQPYIEAQQQAVAANLAGTITGPVVGGVASGINSAAVVLGDLILFAAYTNNGGPLLNQLQTALPALTAPGAAAALGAPDYSGLSAAFAAAAAAPPLGVPALPQLPAPPPGLPTPEQVLGGLAALPALPPPPAIGLPTPEQVAGGLFALPAIGLPALPPPPPIGLPQLPPPPPIGLPTIGLPSIGLPSITRMLGLPF